MNEEESRLVHDVFAGPDGERALAVLRRMFNADCDLFFACDSDRALAYLCGRRSAYLDIQRMIREGGDEREEED